MTNGIMRNGIPNHRNGVAALVWALGGLALGACGDDTKASPETCVGVECEGSSPQRDLGLDLPTDDRGAILIPPVGAADAAPVEGDALQLIDGSLPPDAFKPPETCATRDDGVCDEPSAGGTCPAGSDPEDCRGGEGPECMEAAECPAGEYCRLGQCVPTEADRCETDSDCGDTEYCDVVTGACNEDAPPGGCQRSADCGPGEICNLGTHTCEIAGGGECTIDADCGLDAACVNGACVPDAVGPGGCIDDTDCAVDEYCEPDFGFCVPAGGGGCFGDFDCAPDEYCDPDFGICLPGGGGGDFCPYEFDFECDEPEGTGLCPEGTDPDDCAGGPGPECFEDFDCFGADVCRNGVCVADPAGGGDGTAGARCTENNPFCDFGLTCVGQDGVGTCREACNANAARNECARTEICVPTEVCDPDFFNCSGFCFPDDDCTPQNAAADCGLEAYCDILGRASACTPAGEGAVGDACAPPGALGCQAGLACLYGTCVAPCDAAAACAGDETCVDLSADFGADLSVCMNVCDPYDARSCGALVACELMDVVQTGALGLCRDGVQAGRGAAGDVCREDDAHYWGTCNSAHVCDYPDPDQPFGDRVCLALCDAAHPEACTGGTACVEGQVPLDGLGLCLGECDPTAPVSGCPDGNTCRPRGVGPLGEGEALVGVCSDNDGRLPRYEDCFKSFDGSSDCAAGLVCAEEARFDERCLSVCDAVPAPTHPCPAGTECRVGAFETLAGDAASTVWGVCVRDVPGPRCPLPDGEPVPEEICNGVDDDCDGQSDIGPGNDRRLDCPAGEQCFGGSCF